MKKRIAVTGGIGSGKSLVTSYIAEMGYPIFSCDEINRTLLSDAAYAQEIGKTFPTCVINGVIDKKALQSVAFADEGTTEKLNRIAHPYIMKRLFAAMDATDAPIVFAEVPLLFEGNFENCFDEIIVVLREFDERVKAVQERDGFTEEEILARINRQFDYTQLSNKPNFDKIHILKNIGGKDELKAKVKNLLKKLLT